MNLTVNGVSHQVGSSELTPLLDVLRLEVGVTGPKAGCHQGGCGAWPSEGECVIAEVANPTSRSQRSKLSFDNGGDFIRQTRREVDEYLSARVRTRGRIDLYAKGVVAFVLLIASWTTLVLGHPGVSLGLIAFGGLILGTSLMAFCVMHDANHGAYFRTRRLNHLMGWTADALLGLSSYAWRVKHNVAHHTYTNVDGYDADITQMPFARLMHAEPFSGQEDSQLGAPDPVGMPRVHLATDVLHALPVRSDRLQLRKDVGAERGIPGT